MYSNFDCCNIFILSIFIELFHEDVKTYSKMCKLNRYLLTMDIWHEFL